MTIILFAAIIASTIHATFATETHESNIRHFRSRWSDVYIVPNFLPIELATSWQAKLKQAWTNTSIATSELQAQLPVFVPGSGTDSTHNQQEQSCSVDINMDMNNCTNQNQTTFDQTSTFLYATNNQGTPLSKNNAKTRSLEHILQRNATARKMLQNNEFSYAKWELHPSHSLVKEMESHFSSHETRSQVQSILESDSRDGPGGIRLSGELSDLFVTLYSTGDFLSPHDDGAAGTWAFVVSLMDSSDALPSFDDHDKDKDDSIRKGFWNERYGGGLQFQCETEDPRVNFYDIPWCEVLYPKFNSAVFIQTRVLDAGSGHIVPGPIHQVLPVDYEAELEGFFRFGLTGWYSDLNDVMSKEALRERDRMRARD